MEETSWTPEVGENLIAAREESNRMDRHGVAVIKYGDVVGHLPKKLSQTSGLFIAGPQSNAR